MSYDSAYIASIGEEDRVPKVWRRLNYGPDDVHFDFTYLRHPDIVTALRWRRPFHIEQAAENVLYTICLDDSVRIWTPTDTIDGQHWQLWGRVAIGLDVRDGPGSLNSPLVFIIDGRDFTASVERAVEARMADDSSTDDVALDYLVAVANKNPEICVAVGSHGVVSAWALENVSSRTAESPVIFSVANIASEQFQSLEGFLHFKDAKPHHVEIHSYCDKSTGKLNILLHCFDGRIGVFATNVADLLDPTTNTRRLSLQSIWTGHSSSVRKIIRDFSGRVVVSRATDGEIIVWKHTSRKSQNLGLTRSSLVPETDKIHRICALQGGRFVVFLGDQTVSLWDCHSETACCLARSTYQLSGKPLCLIILPRPYVKDNDAVHIATITNEKQGIVWEVIPPQPTGSPDCFTGAELREFCCFELNASEGLAYVLPVDPAGSRQVVSGFLDVFARDVAISYTRGGRVDFWTARVDLEKRSVDWLSTCSTETGLSDPALVSGSMLKKAALVNSTRSQVTIWDIGGSRLEFDEDHETQNVVQDLDWTSTPDSQSVLAVGFQYRVVLLSQMRFDYLNKGPAWAPIHEISIRDFTPHPIGDSTWLGGGHLVIGAGNQMFVQDRHVRHTDSLLADIRLSTRKDGSWDLFEVVQRFNGPLPVFHPQFLSQCILSGKNTLVSRILVELHKALKYLVAGETVDDYLGIDPEDFYMTVVSCQRANPLLPC